MTADHAASVPFRVRRRPTFPRPGHACRTRCIFGCSYSLPQNRPPSDARHGERVHERGSDTAERAASRCGGLGVCCCMPPRTRSTLCAGGSKASAPPPACRLPIYPGGRRRCQISRKKSEACSSAAQHRPEIRIDRGSLMTEAPVQAILADSEEANRDRGGQRHEPEV